MLIISLLLTRRICGGSCYHIFKKRGKMNTYDIVVLDTGVEIKHEALHCFSNIECKCLLESKNEIIDEIDDIFGHGTAVTWLIKQRIPEASILSLRIFDIVDGVAVCSEERLINTLNYIDTNYSVKVINLSSSIVAPQKMRELEVITKKLANKGVVIVSPHHNNYSLSYPASFEWVIGVAIDERNIRETRIITGDKVLNIIDPIKRYKVPWKNNSYLLKCGASFSCCEISSLAYSYINSGSKNYLEVLGNFKKNFFFINMPTFVPKIPKFKIHRAIAFPFNKEIHSIVRFSNELPFDLIDIYDVKYSLNVGRTTAELLSDSSNSNYVIKNIDNVLWNSFDTLILGCVKELYSTFKDYRKLKDLINQATKNGKNIYAFENINEFLDLNISENYLFYPEVGTKQMMPYRWGRLSKTSSVVLGVFGTSSKQGKFTLQMELRRELKNNGCKVGHIGTEPSSLLFGIDYVFPMGYNSTVYLKEEEKIAYCNDLIRKLSESCADIILVGSQRDVIPKNFENISQLCTSTYSFLQGTNPDYAIIMVSIEDDDEYITRTIHFLSSITKTETIAFVVFPMIFSTTSEINTIPQKRKISSMEFTCFKEHIEKHFSIPVFLLGEQNLAKKLLKLLQKHLEL